MSDPQPSSIPHRAPVIGGVEVAPGVRVAEDMLGFTFVRSSGPGGQNVNKLSTKAVLRIRVTDLPLRPDAATRLRSLAGFRLTTADELLISSDAERSQEANRARCLDELRKLLVQSLTRPKRRRATKPSYGSKQRRLQSKKLRGETKRLRRDHD